MRQKVSRESLENDIAYADELADEEWVKKYEEEVDETNKLEHELRERLERSVKVDSWWVSANLSYDRVKIEVKAYVSNRVLACLAAWLL